MAISSCQESQLEEDQTEGVRLICLNLSVDLELDPQVWYDFLCSIGLDSWIRSDSDFSEFGGDCGSIVHGVVGRYADVTRNSEEGCFIVDMDDENEEDALRELGLWVWGSEMECIEVRESDIVMY